MEGTTLKSRDRYLKSSRTKARNNILKHMVHKDSACLIGELCINACNVWTLEETENLLEEMVDEGVIRRTTPEENQRLGVSIGYVLKNK